MPRHDRVKRRIVPARERLSVCNNATFLTKYQTPLILRPGPSDLWCLCFEAAVGIRAPGTVQRKTSRVWIIESPDRTEFHEPLVQIKAHILAALVRSKQGILSQSLETARRSPQSFTNLQKCSSKPSHLSLHFRQEAPAPNSCPRVICKQKQ